MSLKSQAGGATGTVGGRDSDSRWGGERRAYVDVAASSTAWWALRWMYADTRLWVGREDADEERQVPSA